MLNISTYIKFLLTFFSSFTTISFSIFTAWAESKVILLHPAPPTDRQRNSKEDKGKTQGDNRRKSTHSI